MKRKTCRLCNLEKDLTEFRKVDGCKDGYNHRCKTCLLINKRKYYQDNKNKYRDYYECTKEERLKYQKEYWSKNPSIRNKVRNDYRVSKISATIKSLTQEDHDKIKEFYEIAKWMTEVFEEPFHVDHIIPLQHELVCGLHVPWNLQILPAKENISKSNNFEI